MIEKYLSDPNFLNIYRFGSQVYKTNSERSDEDFICIVGEKLPSIDINLHIYNKIEFQHFLDEHNIQMLECFFLPNEYKLKEMIKLNFTINLNKLRSSISTASNGSWVKGKKKLTVQADYNKYLGIKSIFHSLRILNFGLQIAKTGKIYDYSIINNIWLDILEISKDKEFFELWESIEGKYKKEFNSLKSEFVSLCPKGYTKDDIKRQKLVEVLDSFGIQDEILTNEIYSIFVKN